MTVFKHKLTKLYYIRSLARYHGYVSMFSECRRILPNGTPIGPWIRESRTGKFSDKNFTVAWEI
jgi:hypothetical protein